MADYISQLITRYFNRRHVPDTEIKVQRWLVDEDHLAEKDDVLRRIWGQINEKADKNTYASLKEVNAKIGMRGSRSWWLNYAFPRVAAVLVPLVVCAGVWFYQANRVDMAEVATLAGEQKEVRLPDGSTVWLNACSKIRYPERFRESSRQVCLTGEAYFSVTRNERKPFEVVVKDVTVEVLGTQFNVRAYPDDGLVTTTLTSGMVAVLLPEKRYTLRPTQELVYNIADGSVVVKGGADSSTSWRDGSLIFNGVSMRDIFKELERKFDVRFDCSQYTLPDDRFSAKFTSAEGLTQVLDVLRDVAGGGFIYRIDGKTILIIKE